MKRKFVLFQIDNFNDFEKEKNIEVDNRKEIF